MSKLDCAYAAGYFDADGSVSISLTHESISVQVTVANRDYTYVRRLYKVYGGTQYMTKSDVLQWRSYASHAEPFLRDMLPYVMYKKKQVKLALIAINKNRSMYDRYRASLEVCKLNQQNLSKPRHTITMGKLEKLLERLKPRRVVRAKPKG